MSYLQGDDYGKKFQLTYSLLHRLLCQAEYDDIKVVEPVIIVTKDGYNKQLKSPAYKHAVISNRYLYIVNTPAKQNLDLIFAIPLIQIVDIKWLHDVPDFLHGNLQNQAQHIQLICKQFLNKEYALTTSADDEINSGGKGTFLTNDSDTIVSYKNSNGKTNKSKEGIVLQKEPYRPLPKPMGGTETLNASYTSSMLLTTEGHIISNPVDNLSAKSGDILNKTDNAPVDCSVLNASFSSKRLHSINFTNSWSDIVNAESSQKKETELRSLSSGDAMSGGTSHYNTLTQSLSAKIFHYFGSKDNIFASRSVDNVSGVVQPAALSEDSKGDLVTFQDEDDCEGTFDVDVFTVSKSSTLFNVLRESWIFASIAGTLKFKTTDNSLQNNCVKTSKLTKLDVDIVMQRFSQLKEEIIRSNGDGEMFLLTKELKFACRRYSTIKRMTWKSGSLLRFYLFTMTRLVASSTSSQCDRMDEIDILILIGEVFVSVFEGTEMCSSRSMLLNENSASFARDLLLCTLQKPTLDLTDEKYYEELNELLSTWSDTSVLLLYEIINAANQSSWSCSLKEKSFDVVMVARIISSKAVLLENALNHWMQNLTLQLSHWSHATSPEPVVLLYKELVILQFLCVNCRIIYQRIKLLYQEEIKYYINKKENLQRISDHYPLLPILSELLSTVIRLLT